MVERAEMVQDEPMVRIGFLAWVGSSLPVSLLLGRMFRRISLDGAHYGTNDTVRMASEMGSRAS